MRILGIDLGSSNIKALEMDSAFGRYDIHDYHEHVLQPGENPDEELAKIIARLPKAPDKVVVALSSDHATLRNLQLPTKDKKTIQSTIGFELEDELPFPSDESVFDYTLLSQGKQGTSAHVAATLKRHLVSTVMNWENKKLDPDVITTEPWAYRVLLNRLAGPTPQDYPVLLINLGHQKTTFYLHWKGSPIFVRDLLWGGRDLTIALSKKYELPMDLAEAAKLDRGYLITSQTEKEFTSDQIELSNCLEENLNLLVAEIRQIELMTKSTTLNSINQIYLTGGTSLLPGLSDWLENRIGIPTKLIHALSSITPSGVTYSDQTDARFLLAASLALCQVGNSRANCINFRKGVFAKQGKSHEINLKVLKKPLLATGIVAFCLFLSLVVQSTVYQSRLAGVDALLEKNVRSFFGNLSNSALKTYLGNTTVLRTSINKELTKQRELSKLLSPNAHSPLDFLKTLSNTIPQNVVVDLSMFQAGISPSDSYISGSTAPNATMTFLVTNPQTAEKLNTLLADKLSNFQRGKMEEVLLAEGDTKKWKVTFSGKPNEDTYGK